MFDGDSDNTVSDQDLDMPDDPHSEISGNTRRMMDQQFTRPTHTSVGEDFMGLEDTLNNVLQQLRETMESDLAEEVQAPYAHKDLVQHDPILRAQTIEARRKARVAMALLHQPTPSQTFVGCRLEGAQGGTEHVLTMEVDGTHYRQPDALISDYPSVTAFLCGQVLEHLKMGTYIMYPYLESHKNRVQVPHRLHLHLESPYLVTYSYQAGFPCCLE